MKRLYLQLRHAWNEILLWSAEMEVHSAEVICVEAEEESARAAQLLAHNTRKLLEARNAVRFSGYAIEKEERQRFLGI